MTKCRKTGNPVALSFLDMGSGHVLYIVTCPGFSITWESTVLDFLKRLFGVADSPTASRRASRTRSQPRRQGSRSASDRYFSLLGELRDAKKARDWNRAAEVTDGLMDVLPGFVRHSKSEFGDVPPNIPVFTDGARALTMVGDDAGLQRLYTLTREIAELKTWRTAVDDALNDRKNLDEIRRVLADQPGILQTEVKDAIGAEDGRRIAVLLRQLEENGEIRRIRYKRTYVLGPADIEIPLPEDHAARADTAEPEEEEEPDTTTAKVATTFDRAHEQRPPIRPTLIDLESVDYVPLPRAPLRWKEHHKESGEAPHTEDHFELAEDTPWEIVSVEKLPMEDRPDTAYRKLAPHAEGTFLIDDLGKAERFPGTPATLLSVARSGEIHAEAPLGWGLYRWQVNPMGSGFIAMDDGGVTHAYDHRLSRLFATPLRDAPEMSGLMTKYDFDGGNLKNHTRTVALSPDGETYLFTVVDQAFAIGTNGNPRWGAQLPKKEGWDRVAEVSGHAGTSGDIGRALRIMGLDLPISVEDVRTSYRRLAKRWHPDANQEAPDAEERFKEIAWAAEILSGLDPASLAPEMDRAVYQRIDSQQSWEVEGMQFTIQMGMQGSEKHASDWIYASSFAGDGGAYLAGYSGRIVRTDPSGRPWRAYDIGAVPRRIADTDDYLYFLTDTRLYILRERALVRVIDIFEEGELVLGQTGFGLLEKKGFRWFSEEGDYIGGVITNNPIRRVHSTPDGLVIETRQRRARVSGAPIWWER